MIDYCWAEAWRFLHTRVAPRNEAAWHHQRLSKTGPRCTPSAFLQPRNCCSWKKKSNGVDQWHQRMINWESVALALVFGYHWKQDHWTMLYIIKFPFNARSDWLKQRTSSENRARVEDIKLAFKFLVRNFDKFDQVKHPVTQTKAVERSYLSGVNTAHTETIVNNSSHNKFC